MFVQAGLAVFNGFHLAGKLDPEEAQMFGLLSGLMRAGNLTLNISEHELLSMRNVSGRSTLRVRCPQQPSLPSFEVKVMLKGTISDKGANYKIVTPAENRRLELAIQKVLEIKISTVIKKLQSFNSDIINFGEEFRVQQLKQWQEQKWKQIFPRVPFQVKVFAKIERDGTMR